MPIDPTIATSGIQLNPMQSLASMLDVQAKQQQVQGNAISLKERQNLQRVMSDPSQFTDSEGHIDFNRALPLIMRAAPTTGMEHIHALMDAQSKATASQQAINAQTDENRGRIGQVLWGIQEDATPEFVHKTIDTLGQQYKGMELPVSLLKQEYDAAYKQGGSKAATQVLKGAAQHVLPQPTQQNMATGQVSAIPTASGNQLVQFAQGAEQPQGAKIGEPFTPPNQLGTDSGGSTQIVNTATGTAKPIVSAPGGPAMTLPAGESQDTLKQVQGIRANANQAARAIPEQQFNANQIIKLADETNTGKGAHIIAGLKGQFAGIPWTSDSASNYNRLGHFMALQTSQLAQASGLGGTDAAHGIAAEQAGTREWTPDAIKSTSRVNRALSTGAGLFNQGVENAIKNSNGNPFAARDFQNKWASVADVNAMRLYDSIKNKSEDPAGLQETLKELGGVSKDPNSRYQQTLKRVDAMRALINGGQ